MTIDHGESGQRSLVEEGVAEPGEKGRLEGGDLVTEAAYCLEGLQLTKWVGGV